MEPVKNLHSISCRGAGPLMAKRLPAITQTEVQSQTQASFSFHEKGEVRGISPRACRQRP
eukprot:365309-Chlamydomonas_euryale.AAC.18